MSIPITIIAGYLGAGKTTLINRLLGERRDLSGLAILVNDFGDVNVDAELIQSQSPDQQVWALTNGCVCCSISDDLSATLENLDRAAIDRVIIEASGVASPAKLRAQCAYPGFHPRACFVLVDQTSYAKLSTDKYVGQLVQQQIDQADVLIATKGELCVNPPKLHGTAPIHQADEPGVSDLLLAQEDVHTNDSHTASQDPAFQSHTLRQHRQISRAQLEALLSRLPSHITRVKGFVDTADGRLLVQKSGDNIDLSAYPESGVNQLVCIYPQPAEALPAWSAWDPWFS